MSKFSLNIDHQSFTVTKNGLLTGVVYAQFGDVDFPDSSWNDFVAIVLTWWCDSVANFIEGPDCGEVVLRFMDGPFALVVKRTDEVDGICVSTASQRSSLSNSSRTSLKFFVYELTRVCHQVLLDCREKDLAPEGINRLRDSFERLVRVADEKSLGAKRKEEPSS